MIEGGGEGNGDDDIDDEDTEAAQEADEQREAADQAILDSLDDEELGIDITVEDIRLASGALAKVCTRESPAGRATRTANCSATDPQALAESLE